MTKRVRRWLVGSLVALAGSGVLVQPHGLLAQTASVEHPTQALESLDPEQLKRDQLAIAEDLKAQAFSALRAGQFDKTNTLLSKAAELSKDPITQRMASWVVQFEEQRGRFVSERQEQFEKAVKDVMVLLDKGYRDYALRHTARAYLLAADKEAFRREAWVDDLIQQTIAAAEQYDQEEQWLKAVRLYSDLGSVEPANPLWKEKLKKATRRIRLLAMYAPDYLKQVQEAESKEAEQVEALLKPTTQPATQPTAKAEEDDESDPFRVNWQETLRGIHMSMLRDSLKEAQQNYWKDVTYQDLVRGGLRGMEAIVTTKGLENAFENAMLHDAEKRAAFAQWLESKLQWVDGVTNPRDRALLGILSELERVNQQTIRLPEEVLVSEFADGAFGALDPFSSVIWPNDLEEFQKTTQGEFSGVGIQIQSDDDGSLRVVSPLEDSPAYRAGIKAGDIVTHIDGKNAKGITLNQAVKRITGQRGTTVTLTIRTQNGEVKDFPIVRDTIKVASVKGWSHKPGGGWDYFIDPDNRIGYVRLTNFTRTTSEDLDAALAELRSRGAKGLILDLRYNPGGLLQSATEVVDKFLTGGRIVSTRADRDGRDETVTMASPDGNEFRVPLVVLVNQYSASASEIVSGALKDQKAALVIGERTFGKGSVQMLFPLANRDAYLKLTTSHYYLPAGKCIHREENSQEWGVDPDVTIEMTPEQMRAAIDARQELDVLRDAAPAEGRQEKLKDVADEVEDAVAEVTEEQSKDPLSSDPQLSAALLVLRLQAAGATLTASNH